MILETKWSTLINKYACCKFYSRWFEFDVIFPLLLTVCVLIWLLRYPWRLNDFPQWSQGYGFSPEWVLMFLLRWAYVLNDFSQWSHVYGFSPVLCLPFIPTGVSLTILFPTRGRKKGELFRAKSISDKRRPKDFQLSWFVNTTHEGSFHNLIWINIIIVRVRVYMCICMFSHREKESICLFISWSSLPEGLEWWNLKSSI